MNLFPRITKPYLIYAPGYTHKSSGVRSLHLLCHGLNKAGYKAYMVPENGAGFGTNPHLATPLFQIQHQNFYKNEGIDPIVIYPDVVRGNPLNAKHVVRMLLAPRGAYGGDKEFPETDQIWGALPSIADKVLRIPVSDLNIFYPPMENGRRIGTCYYAHKYDKIHGQTLLPITENSVRLEGSLEQIADQLRLSERCYLYEVSSILTEAALCDCPITLVRTPYFNKIDPECMMGNVAWSDGEVVKTCNDYLSEYMSFMINFGENLQEFIDDTQRS